MKNPTTTLISPFGKIWKDLAAQTKAWTTITKLMTHAINLPNQLDELSNYLDDDASQARKKLDGVLGSNARELAYEASTLLLTQREAVVYPGLIGAWAIIEASFDNLMKQILVSDPDVEAKLQSKGIKTTVSEQAGSEEWADELYRKLENKAKKGSGGRVVEIHRACLATLGVQLEYPIDRSAAIEELNQVRNSILHNQGVITSRAVQIAPRLSKYLGSTIPADDPIFVVSMVLLQDYTTAWIASLAHSPYLRSGLHSKAINPFSPDAAASKMET